MLQGDDRAAKDSGIECICCTLACTKLLHAFDGVACLAALDCKDSNSAIPEGKGQLLLHLLPRVSPCSLGGCPLILLSKIPLHSPHQAIQSSGHYWGSAAQEGKA